MIFEGKIESDKAMETVERAIKHQGPLEAKIRIADVHHEVNKARIVVKFEKTSTMKASQNRTAARNKWSPIDAATGRPTYPLTDDDLSEVKVDVLARLDEGVLRPAVRDQNDVHKSVLGGLWRGAHRQEAESSAPWHGRLGCAPLRRLGRAHSVPLDEERVGVGVWRLTLPALSTSSDGCTWRHPRFRET